MTLESKKVQKAKESTKSKCTDDQYTLNTTLGTKSVDKEITTINGIVWFQNCGVSISM